MYTARRRGVGRRRDRSESRARRRKALECVAKFHSIPPAYTGSFLHRGMQHRCRSPSRFWGVSLIRPMLSWTFWYARRVPNRRFAERGGVAIVYAVPTGWHVACCLDLAIVLPLGGDRTCDSKLQCGCGRTKQMVGDLDRSSGKERIEGDSRAMRCCAWCGDRQVDVEDQISDGGVSHVICLRCLSDCLQALQSRAPVAA